MKAIMLSVRPEWVEKILNGEKTIEMRKTQPSCEFPIKVYIYCTKDKRNSNKWHDKDTLGFDNYGNIRFCNYCSEENTLNGKVVGEFTLNEIIDLHKMERLKRTGLILYKGAMDMGQYEKYNGRYAWHISSLKIYDKLKALSEFKRCDGFIDCLTCKQYDTSNNSTKCKRHLTRPPQSYCFVEELEEKKDA